MLGDETQIPVDMMDASVKQRLMPNWLNLCE